MPTFLLVAIAVVVAWGALIAVVTIIGVKSGKLKLKKGGAPGIHGGSRGSDSSLNL